MLMWRSGGTATNMARNPSSVPIRPPHRPMMSPCEVTMRLRSRGDAPQAAARPSVRRCWSVETENAGVTKKSTTTTPSTVVRMPATACASAACASIRTG